MMLIALMTPIRQLLQSTKISFGKLKFPEKALTILEGSVFAVLYEHLSIRKLCSKWIPLLRTMNKKNNESTIQTTELLKRSKKDFVTPEKDNGMEPITILHRQIGSQLSGHSLRILGSVMYNIHRTS